MTTALTHYGQMDKPEEQKKIDFGNNPVDIVIGTYQLWLQVAQREEFNSTNKLSITKKNILYDEAYILLLPYSVSFGNVPKNQLEEIISRVKDADTPGSGLYLSALLNATDLDELDGIFNQNHLGYRLKEGKKLIVRKESIIGYLGEYAGGNIINYGKVEQFALNSLRGNHINFGYANNFSVSSQEGLHINFGNTIVFGLYSNNGIHLNYGYSDMLASRSFKGIQINFENVRYVMAGNANEGLQINLGSVNYFNFDSKRNIAMNFGNVGIILGAWKIKFGNKISFLPSIPFQIYQMIHRNIQPSPVKQKFSDLNELKNLKENPADAIEFIEKYDWSGLEDTLLELTENLKIRKGKT